jgi:hypothetical protein
MSPESHLGGSYDPRGDIPLFNERLRRKSGFRFLCGIERAVGRMARRDL